MPTHHFPWKTYRKCIKHAWFWYQPFQRLPIINNRKKCLKIKVIKIFLQILPVWRYIFTKIQNLLTSFENKILCCVHYHSVYLTTYSTTLLAQIHEIDIWTDMFTIERRSNSHDIVKWKIKLSPTCVLTMSMRKDLIIKHVKGSIVLANLLIIGIKVWV